jgi:hypothetical protein
MREPLSYESVSQVFHLCLGIAESISTFRCEFFVTVEVPQNFVTSSRNERHLDHSESNCSSVECFLYILLQLVSLSFHVV